MHTVKRKQWYIMDTSQEIILNENGEVPGKKDVLRRRISNIHHRILQNNNN